MATPGINAKAGNSVESCVLLAWLKKEGDRVAPGDALCEAETDKAVIEVEAPVEGILLKTFFDVDADVPVQTVIAVIGEAGEDVSPFQPGENTGSQDGHAPGEKAPEGLAESAAPVFQEASASGGLSPRARKLAAAEGVAPLDLAGTGPGGRIIERDVLAALEDRKPSIPEAEESFYDEPIRGVRKITAARMAESLRTTAQLTHHISADAAALLAYRKKLKSSGGPLGLEEVSLNDMLLFLASRVLKDHREFNAHWLGDRMRFFRRVHLGFAVDTPRGLLVPVVKNADLLSLRELSAEARRLALSCREGRAVPEELTGATFTISNLGRFGITSFTPILNPPEVGILGVGAAELKPVERDGEVVFRPHLGLSLTYDHQAVDGAPASRFLGALAQGIADFPLILAG